MDAVMGQKRTQPAGRKTHQSVALGADLDGIGPALIMAQELFPAERQAEVEFLQLLNGHKRTLIAVF